MLVGTVADCSTHSPAVCIKTGPARVRRRRFDPPLAHYVALTCILHCCTRESARAFPFGSVCMWKRRPSGWRMGDGGWGVSSEGRGSDIRRSCMISASARNAKRVELPMACSAERSARGPKDESLIRPLRRPRDQVDAFAARCQSSALASSKLEPALHSSNREENGQRSLLASFQPGRRNQALVSNVP